ncbi:MAG: hypothetical protein JWN75_362 [Candidatus Saccharibacteria bacterium]|nr:hypothetical protein [Candidatus Saccharibacteria bacterium]
MGKQLHLGNSAPDFSVKDVFGKTIKLSKQKKSYTLVAFLRYAECPWCNLAIHRLTIEHPLLSDSNCSIITFIQSPPDKIMTSIFEKHATPPPFPVVADPDLKIYELYDVKSSLKRGLVHHIVQAPQWVKSVAKYGLQNQHIDKNYFLAPAVFLISNNTKEIIYLSYTADLYEHDTFTKLYDTIAYHSIYQKVPS